MKGEKTFTFSSISKSPLYLWRIFGRVERSGTRNIRSSVVSDSKFDKNLRSEREEQDSRIIQDGEG